MRAICGLLFLAVCAYMGSGLYEDLTYGVQTVQAESAEIIESIRLSGIAVRREQQLCSPAAADLPENGKRYAAGALLCMSENGDTLSAPSSALFFEHTDGLEYLSPDKLFPFSPETFESLIDSESESSRHCMGRLVFDNVWYFAAETSSLICPELGQRCRVRFPDIQTECEAAVWAVCSSADSSFMLLRINGGEEQLLSLRKCSAELILSEYRGLKIPKEAVCTDSDGKIFTWVTSAGLVEKRSVDIIYTGDDFCLAKQSYSWEALREGENIVIDREKLEEGLIPG